MEGNYITLIVTLVIWVGLFIYLMRLDKKVKKLEKRMK